MDQRALKYVPPGEKIVSTISCPIGFAPDGSQVVQLRAIAESGSSYHTVEPEELYVAPRNPLSQTVEIQVLRDASGGWYADDRLLPGSFRFAGHYAMLFNAPGPTGPRRLFDTAEELARILRKGNFTPVTPEGKEICE